MKDKTRIKSEANRLKKETNSKNKMFWKKMYILYGDISGYTLDIWEESGYYVSPREIRLDWLEKKEYIEYTNSKIKTGYTYTEKFHKEVING